MKALKTNQIRIPTLEEVINRAYPSFFDTSAIFPTNICKKLYHITTIETLPTDMILELQSVINYSYSILNYDNVLVTNGVVEECKEFSRIISEKIGWFNGILQSKKRSKKSGSKNREKFESLNKIGNELNFLVKKLQKKIFKVENEYLAEEIFQGVDWLTTKLELHYESPTNRYSKKTDQEVITAAICFVLMKEKEAYIVSGDIDLQKILEASILWLSKKTFFKKYIISNPITFFYFDGKKIGFVFSPMKKFENENNYHKNIKT